VAHGHLHARTGRAESDERAYYPPKNLLRFSLLGNGTVVRQSVVEVRGENVTFTNTNVELSGKQFVHVDWPMIHGVFVEQSVAQSP
jgi:hypothetical protein